MPDESVIAFQCPSCSKPYRVSTSLAGRSAKCKKCGAKMRVPELESEPKSSATEDDGFIGFIEDEEDKPKEQIAPSSKPLTFGNDLDSEEVEMPFSSLGGDRREEATPTKKSSSDEPRNFDDEAPVQSVSSGEEAWDGDVESLAAPEGEAKLEPSVFATQATYTAPSAAPRNKIAKAGDGLLKNLSAMWDALVNPSQAAGHIPLTRKISMGGSFLLTCGALLMFFSMVQASPEQVQRVQSVMGTQSTARWAYTVNTMAPVLLVAAVALITGLVVMGWRFWSPRQEEEAKLVTIVYWGTLGLVVGSSFVALVGGAELTYNLSRAGAWLVLIAAAAFGAWVYLRLAGDGDGSMSLLLVAPAIIMPVTFLIIIAVNVPADVIDQLPWGKLFLVAFIMFITLMLMGGAIAFCILIGIPLELLGVIERPAPPVDVPGGAGGTGMMVIVGFCALCYLLLVVARWRMMFKPVAWQFVILLVGVFLMGSLQNFSYRTQVASAERQIAKEDERLTALLQKQGIIGPGVTASHERYAGNYDVFVGYDREEVVFLSNGESMSRKGGFHEGWVDPDAQTLPTYQPTPDPVAGVYDPRTPTDLATFDPTLGRTDTGPVRFINPDIDQPPDMRRPGGPGDDDGPEIVVQARNAHIVFDMQDLIPGEVNPEGVEQPGKLASWMPFPNSPKVIQSIGFKPLFTAKGTIVGNPNDEQLMAYGLMEDRRPKTVLQMVPQFEPSYLPKGYVGPPRSQRSLENRDGVPANSTRWPDFVQPPTVDIAQASPFMFYGYEFDILPDYEVKSIVYDDEEEMWTITVARKDQQELDHPPLQFYFVDAGDGYKRDEYDDEPWTWRLKPHRPKNLDAYYEFGLIGGERFIRFAPDSWRYQSRDDRYWYASQSHGMRHEVTMSISSAMQSPAGILECEAMARSLHRQPKSEPVPLPDNIGPGRAARNDAETIAGSDWNIIGNFAYPKSIGKTLRADIDMENNRVLSMQWARDDVGIFIKLYDSYGGEDAGPFLVQERGPKELRAWTGHTRTVYAYGREVTYERLWEDTPFVRINRGPTALVDGVMYAEVVYYGWLGEKWAEVTLRGREDVDISLGELESYLRLFRLAHLIEITKVSNYEEKVRFWITSSSRMRDMPLAGGINLDDAFKLKKENFRDSEEDAKLVLNDRIDPYGGLDPDVFSGNYTPPKDPEVAVDPPDEVDPEFPPGFEPVEGYERWDVNEAVKQYLGSTAAFGSFTFKPLKDLRASAKNSDQYAEWFARTDSGKVGLTLKFEKLLNDQEPIKVPITLDEATGAVTLQLGRRKLRPDTAPDVTYRDANGLRIWRMLMPQAGGSSLRRCYYLAALEGGHLVIAADYERDKAVQLEAMDASVGSLIDKRLD